MLLSWHLNKFALLVCCLGQPIKNKVARSLICSTNRNDALKDNTANQIDAN